ncbi:MAG: DCC1-like thiol-disulfide oxidoreductase family protein [Verrucomicrobiota bacterium]
MQTSAPEPQFLPPQPLTALVVFYDGACPLCSLIQKWLARQPTRIPLTLIPHQHPRAREIFPPLSRLDPHQNLLLLTNTGFVHAGPDALRTLIKNLNTHPLLTRPLFSRALYHLVHQLRTFLRRFRFLPQTTA